VEITGKSLDSDEIVESIFRLGHCTSASGLKSQIVDLVRDLYPNAELRSFADGAATFLAPKLLIVAVYRLAERTDDVQDDGDDDEQQQLFAA
jgi:hypothetical protein